VDREGFEAIRTLVREFVRSRVVPLENEIDDKDEVPDDIRAACRDMGLFAFAIRPKSADWTCRWRKRAGWRSSSATPRPRIQFMGHSTETSAQPPQARTVRSHAPYLPSQYNYCTIDPSPTH
jgi:alkylation response protein AidB-like acyl-CoA dehydrogenase